MYAPTKAETVNFYRVYPAPDRPASFSFRFGSLMEAVCCKIPMIS